jgi:predicted DNA-binding transcriptional regulator AlpA
MTDVQPFTVTVARASELTGIGRTKLYELAAAGHIQRRYIGPRNYVLVWSSVQAWLDGLPDDPEDAERRRS